MAVLRLLGGRGSERGSEHPYGDVSATQRGAVALQTALRCVPSALLHRHTLSQIPQLIPIRPACGRRVTR